MNVFVTVLCKLKENQKLKFKHLNNETNWYRQVDRLMIHK